jgi:acyl-CoA thioesterase FadM
MLTLPHRADQELPDALQLDTVACLCNIRRVIPGYVASLGWTFLRGVREPRANVLDEVRFPWRVRLTDVDPPLHMNNGRYLTLTDFGRWYAGARMGLVGPFLRHRWWILVAAARIRFRRELRLGDTFELTTRFISWDHKWLYVAHRFERGNFVHAEATVRAVIRGRGGVVPVAEALTAVGFHTPSPPIGDEALGWDRSTDTAAATGSAAGPE